MYANGAQDTPRRGGLPAPAPAAALGVGGGGKDLPEDLLDHTLERWRRLKRLEHAGRVGESEAHTSGGILGGEAPAMSSLHRSSETRSPRQAADGSSSVLSLSVCSRPHSMRPRGASSNRSLGGTTVPVWTLGPSGAKNQRPCAAANSLACLPVLGLPTPPPPRRARRAPIPCRVLAQHSRQYVEHGPIGLLWWPLKQGAAAWGYVVPGQRDLQRLHRVSIVCPGLPGGTLVPVLCLLFPAAASTATARHRLLERERHRHTEQRRRLHCVLCTRPLVIVGGPPRSQRLQRAVGSAWTYCGRDVGPVLASAATRHRSAPR